MPSFPAKQLSVVGGILFSYHFASSVISPFIPFLTHDFFPYLKSNQIGYYSGFLASAYFIGSFFGSFMWGKLSDILGRRPILMCGIMGSISSSVFFGFSMSFEWAVSARFLWGFLDGNLGVAKTYIFEATDEVYHAFTFSLVGASSSLGRIVGPIVGGFLSCPAVRIPGFDVLIFRKFPYLLPCLAAVCLASLNLLASCFFLKETHIREEEDLDSEHWNETISRQKTTQAEDKSSFWCCRPCCKKICRQQTRQGSIESVPIRKLLRDRRIIVSCVLYCLLAFSSILTAELLPLLLVSSHEEGGFNFDTSKVSLVLTGSAIFQIVSQIVFFPILARKFSYKTLFRAAIFMFMIGTVCTPFMNQMTGLVPERDGKDKIQNATEILPRYNVTPPNDLTSQHPAPGVLRYSVTQAEPKVVKSNDDSNIGKCTLNNKDGKTHVAISDVPIKVWAVVVLITAFGIVGRVSSFTAVNVMVGNSALPDFRGTVNGISQSLVAFARLLGPLIGGNLYAWTSGNGLSWPLNFHLAFYLAVLIDVIILCLTLILPDSINKPRVEDIREDAEEKLIDDISVVYNPKEDLKAAFQLTSDQISSRARSKSPRGF
ncbi:uncharacterized protein LOC144873911 [Branchiostoma floridae x Branchiostoma japonicum]